MNNSLVRAVKKNEQIVLHNHSISDTFLVLPERLSLLHIAVIFDNISAVEILCKKYARIQYKNQLSALSLSIFTKNRKIFDILFQHEAQLLGIDYYCALRIAIQLFDGDHEYFINLIEKLLPYEAQYLLMSDKCNKKFFREQKYLNLLVKYRDMNCHLGDRKYMVVDRVSEGGKIKFYDT